MIFHALVFTTWVAHEMLKTECEVQGLQHFLRDLANLVMLKKNVSLLLLHKFYKSFCENLQTNLHFVTVSQSTSNWAFS